MKKAELRDRFKVDLYYFDGWHGVHGITGSKDNAGRCTMLINQNDSEIRQLATFLHEMTHIFNKDFFQKKDVQTIESETRRKIKAALELLLEEE